MLLPGRFVLRIALLVAPQVTVQFAQESYTVAEGGTQSVTVTLSADPERTVTIPLTATNQGDAEDDDYSVVPSTVTFNAGETSKSFTFTATQDTVDDDDESVRLGFGMMPDAWVSAGTPDATTVSITDDDDPFVEVQFAQDAYTAPEGGTVSVSVTLSANPERTVVIPLTTTDQGGAGSTDYSVPLSVTFNTGEMLKTITFSATHDTEDDDDESVLIAFGTLPSRVSAGTTAETTVSITDDDVPQVTVSFGQTAYTVAEGDTVTVTITLSADPERTVEIPLTATNQGSASSADYTVPTSVTFDADEMSKTITFTAADDSIDDDGESVLLAFGTLPTGVSLGTNAQATVSINDDDSAGVSVFEASLTIDEGGSGTYTIVLDSQPIADCERHHQRSIRQHGRDRGAGQPDLHLDRLELAEDGDGERRPGRRRGRRDGHRDPHRDLHRQQLQRRLGQQRGRHRDRRRPRRGDGGLRTGGLQGDRGRRGVGDRHPERGPGADGGDPAGGHQPGRGQRLGLQRRAGERDLQQRGYVHELHADGRRRHPERDRGERQDRLRRPAVHPHTRHRRRPGRDHRHHQWQVRPGHAHAAHGALRQPDVQRGRGEHRDGDGRAEQGPRERPRHLPHDDGTGRGNLHRLLRRPH